MTNRDREDAVLSFRKPSGRGSVEETFFPWDLTVKRFKQEGLPEGIVDSIFNSACDLKPEEAELDKYFNVRWGQGILNYETYLGFDPVRRVGFTLPFRRLEEEILEETPEYLIKKDVFGRHVKCWKNSGISEEIKPAVSCAEDWERLKEYGNRESEKYFTRENMEKAYAPLKEGHDRGDYTVRMNLEGFYWIPRELLGIEPCLYAFYDHPELIHDINQYVLNVYLDKLSMVLDVLPLDVVYIMEDLSGKNGPMISPALFDEFVGDYYRRLIPMLKSKGVRHVFVDTDGDFSKLIPNFMAAGVEGFLPMDVNAGMDIVKVRKEFPNLKFIGGFNKLCIADGKEAIDNEFKRIMPVIRQGGIHTRLRPPGVSFDFPGKLPVLYPKVKGCDDASRSGFVKRKTNPPQIKYPMNKDAKALLCFSGFIYNKISKLTCKGEFARWPAQ